jgi:hypothetical protein
MKRRRHVSAFHSVEGVTFEGKTVRVDVGNSESGAWSEHDDGGFTIATDALGFTDAAVVSVITDYERQGTARCDGESGAVFGLKIPVLEAFWEVGWSAHHAVAFVRAGDRETDASDLIP